MSPRSSGASGGSKARARRSALPSLRPDQPRPRPVRIARDVALILAGSFLFALGVDCFEVPNGLAAGGLTGIATIFYALAGRSGFYLPVGMQTIAMNVLLIVYVMVSTRDRGYVLRSVAGFVVSGLMCDVLAPVLPALGSGDLLLAAIWGGLLQGAGIGIVMLSGGNTGGTDIINQAVSRKTGLAVGVVSIMVDAVIIAASVPVFSIGNALYATVAMFVCGRVEDMVVDGPRAARCAYIISERHDEIADAILNELDRGCTELSARGMWSGEQRPVLMCVLGRTETVRLKEMVARADPDAIVFISEIHEALGEGFSRLGG